MTNGLFEVLAADRDQERVAATRAVIAAQTRAKQRFEKYVSAAASDDERAARLSVIAYDLDTELVRVAEEYGFGDIDHLRNAATVALGGGHAADCECGFCENKGKLPGQKDEDEKDPLDEPDEDKMDGYAKELDNQAKSFESSIKTACGCCEDCKNGKECSCSEHMKTSKIDIKQASASAAEFPWEHVAAAQATEKLAMAVSKRDFEAIAQILKQNGADPTIAQQIAEYFATQNDLFDHDRFMDASGVGQLADPLADAVVAAVRLAVDVETGDTFEQERVDLPSSKDGLGGPSPKIDKGKVPASGLSEIDVPSKAHPSERQSVEDTADYSASDFDPDSPIRDRIDADKPLQPEHNVADNTQTWTGTEGQASPVTSAVLAKWKVLP